MRSTIKDKLISILASVDLIDEGKINQLSSLVNEVHKRFVLKKDEPLKPKQEKTDDFTLVSEKLKSSEWQDAVDPNFLCDPNSSNEKFLRARSIISVMALDNPKQKILDYGCGEGHVPMILAEGFYPELVVGYDINKQWEKDLDSPHLLTDDIEKVKEFAPYDTIILYDVLDHCEEDPLEILNFTKTLIKEGGRIKIRFHPWCSRHGSHLYHQLNKEHIHLIFTEEELRSIGIKEIPFVRKVLNPEKEYDELISKSGMKVVHKKRLWQQAGWLYENTPLIKNRILKHYNLDAINYYYIETNFFDYWLEK